MFVPINKRNVFVTKFISLVVVKKNIFELCWARTPMMNSITATELLIRGFYLFFIFLSPISYQSLMLLSKRLTDS
jgi:hypothetical protein